MDKVNKNILRFLSSLCAAQNSINQAIKYSRENANLLANTEGYTRHYALIPSLMKIGISFRLLLSLLCIYQLDESFFKSLLMVVIWESLKLFSIHEAVKAEINDYKWLKMFYVAGSAIFMMTTLLTASLGLLYFIEVCKSFECLISTIFIIFIFECITFLCSVACFRFCMEILSKETS